MQCDGFGCFHKAAKIQRLRCIFEHNLLSSEVPTFSLSVAVLPLCLLTFHFDDPDFFPLCFDLLSAGKNKGRKHHV